MFDALAGERGGIRGPFPWLLRSPVLCGRHLDVGTFLRSSSQVAAAARELAIIAVAREIGIR